MGAENFQRYLSHGWRWRLTLPNGRTVMASREAYVAERDCDQSIEMVQGSGSALVRRH